MQKLPFYRPSITDAEIAEVVDTLRSGWLTTGPKTKQFEKEFAAYMGQTHAVAVNSCTAALHLALEAIGVKEGDAVIVPTMTFAATAEVVRYLGARPILVDCRSDDFNLDIADAERRIEAAIAEGQRVTCIMPVHYGGQIGDVAGVQSLAKRYGLKIVEDAAHCCPAYWSGVQRAESEGRGAGSGERGGGGGERGAARGSVLPAPCSPHWLPVGTSADISCFSFYANKCITTGEGGMACTNNEQYAERMRIMSLHGISKDAWKRFTAEGSWYYEIIAPGYKYNLTDIASAIGIHQLRRADELHQRRSALAALYSELLSDVEELILPRQLPNRIHSWHLYAIRLKLDRLKIDRGQFIKELQDRGIGISVHWMPLHMHPYYRETYGYRSADLPVSATLYSEIITLPLFPDMTEGDVQHVCDAVRSVAGGQGARSQERGARGQESGVSPVVP